MLLTRFGLLVPAQHKFHWSHMESGPPLRPTWCLSWEQLQLREQWRFLYLFTHVTSVHRELASSFLLSVRLCWVTQSVRDFFKRFANFKQGHFFYVLHLEHSNMGFFFYFNLINKQIWRGEQLAYVKVDIKNLLTSCVHTYVCVIWAHESISA